MRNTTSGQVARLSKVETRGLETTHLDFGKSSYWLRHAAALTVLIVSMWCSAAEVRSTSALLEWLRAPSGPAGFCVHLGCGEGALTIELAAGDRLAVHALEAEARNVEKARERLQARDLYGQATVEQWAMKSLPYAENLVNVLIAENPGAIPQTEMLRVVAPLGTLWVKHGDGWRSEQKPWPRAFDEWTHWRHGPDGNMVSRDTAVTTPTGLRWIAGPPQDVGGRKWYYDHVLVSSSGRNFYQFDDAIVARDSFNGRLLWRREAKAHTFKETITFGTLKLGGRTSKVRPVASGERLYAATDGKLVALDAANGRTVQTFGDLNAPREIALVWRVLLATDADGIRAFELDGKLGWQSDEKSRRMVAGDGRVFLLSDDRVTCLDLATGAVCWRASHPSAVNAVTCSYYRGVLVLERASWSDHAPGNGVVALAGDTGAVLWTKDFRPGMTHLKESRVFLAGGLVWLPTMTSTNPVTVKVIGCEPRTGAPRKEYGSRGLHCAASVATEHYIIAPELEFTDLKTGKQSRARMLRAACRLPFVPANGLLYTFPVQCECFPMLRGYMALAQKPAIASSSAPRLQRGPAYGEPIQNPKSKIQNSDDWPQYRRDRYRSGSTATALGEGDWRPLWEVSVTRPQTNAVTTDWADDPFADGIITAPVCAVQTLLVAVPHRHRVVALDANTGAARWSFTAGGRVDTPPAIAGGVCVFGAHDGYVYCLRLSDGRLVWRFRAAPVEARLPVYGQMESPWPVAGSVLAEDGAVYFAAGRHPMTDGGVRVCALRVADGRLLWEKTLTDIGVKRWYSPLLAGTRQKVGLDYEPVDLLVRDGDKVAMSRWRFEPTSGQVTLALSSTNYVAEAGLKVPRGLWGYGIRQTKQVLHKPPAVFNADQLIRGTTNDVAMLLAGNTVFTATAKAELKIGDQTLLQLPAPLVHDGLITAQGRLYAVTRDGRVICFAR